MQPSQLPESQWPYLLTLLPTDLELSPRKTRALQRRREVSDAATLLRMALIYAATGNSLRSVSAYLRIQGIAQLSDVALLKRLRAFAPWLGVVLTSMVSRHLDLPPPSDHPLRLWILDATAVSRPGSKGTDFRVHLGFNLQNLSIDQVRLTDGKEGETLQNAAAQLGDVVAADRLYGIRSGIAAVVAAGGYVIVRMAWSNLPLCHPDGKPFDLVAALGFL